jgi:hypothetical protein
MGRQPDEIDEILTQGARWWPLAMARELDDAILMLRTNDLDVGLWQIRTRGDIAAVLEADATMAKHRTTGSCARPSASCAAACAASTSPRAPCSPSSTRAPASAACSSSWRSPPTAASC